MYSESDSWCIIVRSKSRHVSLKPHSINVSLGVWGKKELLPEESVLEMTTLCGHHMVSPKIVWTLAEIVVKGMMTPDKAAVRLARLCPCGIFN